MSNNLIIEDLIIDNFFAKYNLLCKIDLLIKSHKLDTTKELLIKHTYNKNHLIEVQQNNKSGGTLESNIIIYNYI